MQKHSPNIEVRPRLIHHLQKIYPELDAEKLAERCIRAMQLEKIKSLPEQHINHWDETDIALITYGNSLLNQDEPPLQTLNKFLSKHLLNTISIVHLLPFFPFSSDDGFAVIDYTKVNDSYGDWDDIKNIASTFKLMADLVINHCSSRSRWFEQFKQDKHPGKNYFYLSSPNQDLSKVVRPRTSTLLRQEITPSGNKYVWCTFSHDQPDLNFQNPEVLIEFIKIINFYLQQGIKIFRLDAIAFLWKQPGGSCINLPQTHELVRLLRTLIEHHTNDAIIITETNIPNRENLAYFGNSNEAHIIYNFPLPPLLLNTLVAGNCHYLKNWLMSMPPAMMGTTYLNFIASHDGIGLRPVEGLLDETEINDLVSTMESFGGQISWRALDDGKNKPYEINITLYDAMKGTIADGPDEYQQQRFLCAHTIMLALEGIPAFYIHSLLATENDHEKYANTNNKRAINRHNWNMEQLVSLLAGNSHHRTVFEKLCDLMSIRKRQAAFHPNATQYTLQLGNSVFGFWRQSLNRTQSIFCIHNISKTEQSIQLSDINLTITDSWYDLITGVELENQQSNILLEPYQSIWLSNRLN